MKAIKATKEAAKEAHRAEMEKLVLLDGLSVRRRRHDRGWSPRDLIRAISEASFVSSGLRQSLTPIQIQAIEERDERVPYASLLLLADGLDCDPADLMGTVPRSQRRQPKAEDSDPTDTEGSHSSEGSDFSKTSPRTSKDARSLLKLGGASKERGSFLLPRRNLNKD